MSTEGTGPSPCNAQPNFSPTNVPSPAIFCRCASASSRPRLTKMSFKHPTSPGTQPSPPTPDVGCLKDIFVRRGRELAEAQRQKMAGEGTFVGEKFGCALNGEGSAPSVDVAFARP